METVIFTLVIFKIAYAMVLDSSSRKKNWYTRATGWMIIWYKVSKVK